MKCIVIFVNFLHHHGDTHFRQTSASDQRTGTRVHISAIVTWLRKYSSYSAAKYVPMTVIGSAKICDTAFVRAASHSAPAL